MHRYVYYEGMSLHTRGLAVEIGVSTMDLYPAGPRGTASWQSNLEQLVPYLQATGCRNFELWPTRAIVDDVSNMLMRGDTGLVNLVCGSTHQSAFNDRD